MNIIQQLEKEQADKLEALRPIPEFGPGDTVRIIVKIHEVKEGAGRRTGSKNQKGGKSKDKREAKTYRTQAFEGVCIARSGGGINESFTVRKISYGEGVERVFPVYSPNIEEIQVLRRGRVRRAKLYYLRGLRGKSARIAEKKENAKKK